MHNLETVHIVTRQHSFDFEIRRDTSDRQVIKEVIERNAYRRRYFVIESGERWLDLGANIGAFTCLASKCGAQVQAYEPEPENVQLLKRNLSFNDVQADVFSSAVVSDQETAAHLRLFLSTDYGKWGHSLYKAKRKKSILVPTVHFGDLLSGIDGIKMDIEGAEIPILSCVETMANVQKLVFEWHFDMHNSIPFFLETIDRLRRFFPNIKHRTFKPGDTIFRYFPTDAVVFCWK